MGKKLNLGSIKKTIRAKFTNHRSSINNMETTVFQQNNQKYQRAIDFINNEVTQNSSSKFLFSYIDFSSDNTISKNDVDRSKQPKFENLHNSLKNHKFLTYIIFNYNNSNFVEDAIICIEDQCIIIESINSEIFKELIKGSYAKIIDVDNCDIKKEIQIFCNNFDNKLKKGSDQCPY